MNRELDRNAPCLSSLSSSTLYAANLFGSTPCIPKMVILVLENPHWGRSGVPFMNNTTGLDATALSIVALVSVDRSRNCAGVSETKGLDLKNAGRKARRPNCPKFCKVYGKYQFQIQAFGLCVLTALDDCIFRMLQDFVTKLRPVTLT